MDKPTKCPKCGGSPLWRTPVSETEESKTYSVHCRDCSYRWKETYATYLTRIEPEESQISVCPYCDNRDHIQITKAEQMTGDIIRLHQHCDECHKNWADVLQIKRLSTEK